MGRYAESQLDVHTAGIPLDRGVDEIAHLGKFDDLVHLGVDLGAGHAQDGAVEVDIFPAGHLGMEAGAHLQHGSHPAIDVDVALGGRGDVGEQFEQGGFAGAVGADDPHSLAPVHVKTDAVQRHEGGADKPLVGADDGIGVLLAALAGPPALQVPPQGAAADLADLVLFLHVPDADHDVILFFHDARLLTRCPRRSFRPC